MTKTFIRDLRLCMCINVDIHEQFYVFCFVSKGLSEIGITQEKLLLRNYRNSFKNKTLFLNAKQIRENENRKIDCLR